MMIKRSGAVLIAYNLSMGLLALTITSVHSSAHAQSADLVLCDRIAADPADPDKPIDVKGVSDSDQILPDRVSGVAPSALRARSCLRGQSTIARGH
jgi:hypothetical protein